MNHVVLGIYYSLVPSEKVIRRQPGYYLKADAFGKNGNMIVKGEVIGPIEEKVAAACLHFIDAARLSNADNWTTLSALIGDLYDISVDVYDLLQNHFLVLDKASPGKVEGEVFYYDGNGGCRDMILKVQE